VFLRERDHEPHTARRFGDQAVRLEGKTDKPDVQPPFLRDPI
jgi:hypothetical protein